MCIRDSLVMFPSIVIDRVGLYPSMLRISSGKGNGAVPPRSVSYTHLDVYKRQLPSHGTGSTIDSGKVYSVYSA